MKQVIKVHKDDVVTTAVQGNRKADLQDTVDSRLYTFELWRT